MPMQSQAITVTEPFQFSTSHRISKYHSNCSSSHSRSSKKLLIQKFTGKISKLQHKLQMLKNDYEENVAPSQQQQRSGSQLRKKETNFNSAMVLKPNNEYSFDTSTAPVKQTSKNKDLQTFLPKT